jgi:glucose-6-phosphate isomerase
MKLTFGNKTVSPDVRYIGDLLPVLYTPDVDVNKNEPAYFMYRDLYLSKKDRSTILEYGLRYDITIIPPKRIGKEYIKTLGHYHPPNKMGTAYTEIYEVLDGEAMYFFQRVSNGDVLDVIVVRAEAGDKVLIPPEYGHITINPSNKILKMSNWVYRHFSSIYDPIIKRKGGCYYYLSTGWIPNNNYKKISDLRILDPPRLSSLGIKKGKEMYGMIKNPEKLEFLWSPEAYMDVFQTLYDITY